MNFFEFQHFIVKDHLFEDFIIRRLQHDRKKIKETQKYTCHREQIIYVYEGTFICENSSTIYSTGEYICEETTTLHALEDTKVCEFDKSDVVKLLDEEGTLANFFFMLLNQNKQRTKFASNMLRHSPRDRAAYLLQAINAVSINDVILKNIGYRALAQYCNCSINTIRSLADTAV